MLFLEKSWKMENMENEARKKYLASEQNYHTTSFFSEYLLAIAMKKHNVHKLASLFRFINIEKQQSSCV